jgi:hypothetical protein
MIWFHFLVPWHPSHQLPRWRYFSLIITKEFISAETPIHGCRMDSCALPRVCRPNHISREHIYIYARTPVLTHQLALYPNLTDDTQRVEGGHQIYDEAMQSSRTACSDISDNKDHGVSVVGRSTTPTEKVRWLLCVSSRWIVVPCCCRSGGVFRGRRLLPAPLLGQYQYQ